jgi:hypothetical protein
MYKHLFLLISIVSLNLLAAPMSPLDYAPSRHSNYEIRQMYRAMFKDDLKGEDCFKRAYIWSYQFVNQFNARPIKVFFHYTDKFNFELDSQGESGSLARLLNGGSKIVWDFHVAPAVENEKGEIIVLDPIVFPKKGIMKLNEWIDGLAARGEFYLKKRSEKLFDDLEKADKKLDRNKDRLKRQIKNEIDTQYTRERISELENEIKSIKDKMKYLGIISKGRRKKITCSEITNIEDFDKNQWDAWCFYQKSSMYYFAPGELRVLNYGTLGNHKPGRLSTQEEINALINSTYRFPVNEENIELEKYFRNGNSIYSEMFYQDGANYVMSDFTDYYLELSLSEVKAPKRPDLEWFKTHLKLKDPELERRLEREREEEEERLEALRKEEERRQRRQRRADRERRRRERRNN